MLENLSNVIVDYITSETRNFTNMYSLANIGTDTLTVKAFSYAVYDLLSTICGYGINSIKQDYIMPSTKVFFTNIKVKKLKEKFIEYRECLIKNILDSLKNQKILINVYTTFYPPNDNISSDESVNIGLLSMSMDSCAKMIGKDELPIVFPSNIITLYENLCGSKVFLDKLIDYDKHMDKYSEKPRNYFHYDYAMPEYSSYKEVENSNLREEEKKKWYNDTINKHVSSCIRTISNIVYNKQIEEIDEADGIIVVGIADCLLEKYIQEFSPYPISLSRPLPGTEEFVLQWYGEEWINQFGNIRKKILEKYDYYKVYVKQNDNSRNYPGEMVVSLAYEHVTKEILQEYYKNRMDQYPLSKFDTYYLHYARELQLFALGLTGQKILSEYNIMEKIQELYKLKEEGNNISSEENQFSKKHDELSEGITQMNNNTIKQKKGFMDFFKKKNKNMDRLMFYINEIVNRANAHFNSPDCYPYIERKLNLLLQQSKNEIDNWNARTDVCTFAYKILYNITFDVLSSGEMHLYRGKLDPMKPVDKLMYIIDECLNYYVIHGIATHDIIIEQKKILMENISKVG